MKEKKMRGPDIVAILALGAAAGAVLPGNHILLSCAVTLACGSVAICIHIKSSVMVTYLMVFLAGLCRGMQWKIAGGGDWLQDLPAVRNAFEGLCSAIRGAGLSEEAEPLVMALIAGDRSGIAPEVRSAFRSSGASHLLALSGLHLGIIYGILSRILGLSGGHPVAVKIRGVLICASCGFYALLTGASPSIMRAFLFIILRETAMMTGRSRDPLAIFSSALAIHLAASPGSVMMPGFQLSYLAMCGIYLLFPHMDALYPARKHDPLKKIWSLACLSISCQLFTAPVAWFHFRSFPQWFLLTNMIAMPLATLLMVTAVATVALSAAGVCPDFMVHATDLLARALIWSLKTVSAM